MRKTIWAAILIVATVIGCGPNITSGKVVGLHKEPAYTTSESTGVYYMPCGDTFMPIFYNIPAEYHPETYHLIVEGHDHGKWSKITVGMGQDKTFGGYKVGDTWREAR